MRANIQNIFTAEDISPIIAPKGFFSIPVCDVLFDKTKEETPVSYSFWVREANSGKEVYSFSYQIGLRPQNRRLYLFWNPLSFPERLNLAENDYEIRILIKSDKETLLEKTYLIRIEGLKESLEEVEGYNYPIPKEELERKKREGIIYAGMRGIANLTGWTADKWYLLDAKKAGVKVLDIRMEWGLLEPQRGVFNWSILDKAVKWAEELGIPIIISVCWSEMFASLPPWIKGDEYEAKPNIPVNQPMEPEAYCFGFRMPSFASSKFREDLLEMTKKVVERYKEKEIVIGWNISPCNDDNVYTDSPLWKVLRGKGKKENPDLYLLDYSYHAQQAFRKYLSQKYGDIGVLNEVYGTSYKDFSEVELPQPNWKEELDLRPIWLDFQHFKVWLAADLREEQFHLIRKLDREKQIYGFGLRAGILDHYLVPFKKYNATLNITVFGPIGHDVYGHICRKNGVKFITECYWTQPVITREIFDVALLQSIRCGAIGHIAKRPYSNSGIYTGDFAQWEKAFFELIGSEPVQPNIGLLCSFLTSLAREKTFYTTYYPLGNLNFPQFPFGTGINLFYTLEFLGFTFECFSDYTELNELPYKLVIDTHSQLLPQRTIEKLVEFVQKGGNLLLFSDSGIFSFPLSYPNLWNVLGLSPFKKGEIDKAKIAKVEKGWEEILGLQLHQIVDLPEELAKESSIIAWRSDGKPGILMRKIGKGNVIVISGVIDWKLPRGTIIDLSGIAGQTKDISQTKSAMLIKIISRFLKIEPTVEILKGKNIRSCLTKKGENYYLMIYNAEENRQNLCVRVRLGDENARSDFRVDDLLENRSLLPHIKGEEIMKRGIEVPLEGKTGAVLKISKYDL